MGSVRAQSPPLSDEVSGMAMVENRAGSAPPYDSITRKTHVWQLGECVSSKEIIKVRGKEGTYAFSNYLRITYVQYL